MHRFAAGLALVLMPVSALAAQPPEGAPSTATVLHLSAEAQRLVPRDLLRAVLRVEGVDADPARLQAEINRRMAAAVAQAKAVPGLVVATGGYSLYQERPKGQPAQWHGAESLTLSAHDAASLLALTGRLQQNGLVTSSLDYELSPEAAQASEDALTEQALQRLRRRAARVAASLGLAVERIRDLRLGNAVASPPAPRFFMARGAVSAKPVAEPGEAPVSVSVDADVELGPKR